MFDRGNLGDLIDGLTKLSEAIGFVINKIGLFSTAIAGVGITTFIKSFA